MQREVPTWLNASTTPKESPMPFTPSARLKAGRRSASRNHRRVTPPL
jgi:hypothetical protein